MFSHNNVNERGMMMVSQNEVSDVTETDEEVVPLYMRWWLWALLFILTAVVVNITTDQRPHLSGQVVEPVENDRELPVEVGAYESVFPEDASPVFGDAVVPEERDGIVPQEGITTFRVGDDIAPGEYFVFTKNAVRGYLLLTASPHLEPSSVLFQKHFDHHFILTLKEEEYLSVSNATLVPVVHAVVPSFYEGVLGAGTYRVGKDIPAGIFILYPLEGAVGFFERSASSTFKDSHVIEQRNFSTPITIGLNEGEYVTFIRGEIRK